MSDAWLVVGLGNPGPAYAATRHNVGQMAVDELADRLGAKFSRHKTNSVVAEGWIHPGAAKLIVAKPLSFMNNSGGPVSQLAKFYSLPAERVVVLHDELDLPFDTVRLKQGGGHGGHNGLRDIISALGTPEFLRVRLGIGRPPGRQDSADFVLKPFASTERAALPSLLTDAVDATEQLVDDGLLAAQQRWHAPRA
ncbi:aminoacyl-tRNA hydrolase [Schumannella sp. 10F1B-5-1]|uniref:aminoacyl-tRNA hydrolase n=1 Tax=Schumannella sp. 10F1B-5-1 TaxID=2590780 RepID=UPI00113079B2|nr:aminoacyl-tRNA hydrolase [Schumannella sp. 10F1B-5-1]TPW73031.1 aminoacyl-tRNA hydrolase [Schumannella sp. 10F1B-5-1]